MEILNQFGVNPILLLAQVVNFLVLLFILKRFLYKPILKVLGERRQKIEQSLKNAEEIEKRLSQTNEEVEKILAKALKQGQEILDQSKETGIQMVEEYKALGVEILEKANEQALEVVKLQKIKLEQEMKAHVGDLIVLAFEKVTGKRLTTEDQRKIVDEEVKNLV